ncbi:MAG TPA: lantibiotic dehydratase [Longimicrobium sp.]|uniref:lantibiotic dehydratase n=1 Tax=Longimicrobium sp. TaxID=2029185 RepID=UPI002ED854DF
MDDAAQPGADSLFPRFVCRVGGAPVDTVDELRAGETLRLTGELARVDARIASVREAVSERLFEAIGAAPDKPARNKLIALKRELYNGKVPSAARMADAEALLDAVVLAQVKAAAADLEAARGLEERIRAAYGTETAALRTRFAGLVRDADFRKGLLVSSRALYAHLDRYVDAATRGELTGRDEKTERGLLRYYTRMAAKATPFATFCAIIPGSFVAGEAQGSEGETVFDGSPRNKRSFVRINKFLYGLLFDHLKTRPAVRHALRVEGNPTIRAEGGRLVFLTAIDGREVFQRLADNEVLQLIASRFADGAGPTLGDLIGALSSDPEIDATPDEAEAYLNKLIEIGFLRFHTGIREQDADWDLPFRELLRGVDDDHARRTGELLEGMRERVARYSDAGVEERAAVIDDMHALILSALEAMEIKGRLRKDMPFYEDATSSASASIALTPGVRRAFSDFDTWVRLTARLAWPRAEQATMRHFFESYYGSPDPVPLLKFYEDFYREHFKAHVEKEQQRNKPPAEGEAPYDVGNPFGLQVIRDMGTVRSRLSELYRNAWNASPRAESVEISPADVEAAVAGAETVSGVPRSMGAFALLVPGGAEGGDPSLMLQASSYTAGYGKYFSRFLYMLPDDVQQDVRAANAALSGDLLAEICGDAQFNANLHPPLLQWEISYPTGESGATEQQLRSSEIVVQPDPEDPHALCLMHGPSGRRVLPVDLGFLNPRMRPPLYQLLSRFTPPVMFAPPIPDSPEAPRPNRPAANAPNAVDGADRAGTAGAVGAADGAGAAPSPAGAAPSPADAAPVANDAVPAAPAPVAAEGDAPAPRIVHRPRITFGRLVLARRRWSIPGALFPQRRPDESGADFFVRANRWRVENGMPETAYLRIQPMPEPRPAQPGAPAEPEQPAAEAAEIPGYEAHAEGEGAEPAEEAHDEPTEAAAEGQADAAAPAKKHTQPSRDFFKPQFVDFGNPLVVALLGRVATGLKHFSAVLEERYPDREALARHDGEAYATELVVQLYFPGGTASTPAAAAEEVLAAR